jgi:hypothetical protein
MNNRELRKVLIINAQSIYKNNATGITMRSIVSQLPCENVLELFRDETHNKVNTRFPFQSVQLPPKAMPLNYIVRKAMHLDNYYEVELDKQDSVIETGGCKNTLTSILRVASKAILENTMIFAPKNFLEKIDAFKPEIIYTMGSSFYVHKWVLFFQKRYRCPVVMHYMDNWRQTQYLQDRKLFWINRKLEHQLAKIENNMEYGLTISTHMAKAYRDKYKHSYLALMNTVSNMQVNQVKHEKLQLVYAGGLHLGRDAQLLDLENAISDSNDLKETIRLIIYTSKSNIKRYSSLFNGRYTEFREALPHEQVSLVYEQADVLIHVESFDSRIIEYTKYSLSTKIPEYMASGKPILCYAPDNIASFQYVEKTKTGICVNSRSELINSLKILVKPDNRDEYGKQGVYIAKKNHSINYLTEVIGQVFGKSYKLKSSRND